MLPPYHFAAGYMLMAFTPDKDLKKKIFYGVLFGLISVSPDLDVLFRVHRSFSHSLVFITMITLPLIIRLRGRSLFRYAVLAYTAYILHILLDLQDPTPALWPIFNGAIWISASFYIKASSPLTINAYITPHFEEYEFKSLSEFLYKAADYNSLIFASLMILAFTLVVASNLHSSKPSNQPSKNVYTHIH